MRLDITDEILPLFLVILTATLHSKPNLDQIDLQRFPLNLSKSKRKSSNNFFVGQLSIANLNSPARYELKTGKTAVSVHSNLLCTAKW